MRRAAFAIAIFALTACSAEAPATPAATASPSMTVPSVPTLTATAVVDREAYTAELHRTLGDTNYAFVGDDELIELGETVCRAADAGKTRTDLAALAEDSGIEPATLSAVIAAATTHLCPQHAGF